MNIFGNALTDIFLLALLALTAFAVIRIRNLFAVAMLSGIYSLLSAGVFVSMDAVDVAFTEASVGAGISTVFMLSALALTTSSEKPSTHTPLLPLIVVFITGAALIYGTADMPPYGAADNPVHQHVAPHYIQRSAEEIDIPNIVTSVLASYRGFDTFGEVVVVFTAAVGVLLLLAGRARKQNLQDKKHNTENQA